MIKRSLWLLLALMLMLATAAGCSLPVRSEVTQVEDSGGAAADDDEADAGTEAGSESEESAAPAALPLETDGEKASAQVAQSEESRTWASGDTVNGTPVSGDPFLVGYGVLLHDGTTQYQVRVIDGKVAGAFGKTAEPRYIEAPFANYNPTVAPASARQTEAFNAAKAEIAAINPNATQGGIEFYAFFYPPIDETQYPEVCLLASPTQSASPHAMGGTYGWR